MNGYGTMRNIIRVGLIFYFCAFLFYATLDILLYLILVFGVAYACTYLFVNESPKPSIRISSPYKKDDEQIINTAVNDLLWNLNNQIEDKENLLRKENYKIKKLEDFIFFDPKAAYQTSNPQNRFTSGNLKNRYKNIRISEFANILQTYKNSDFFTDEIIQSIKCPFDLEEARLVDLLDFEQQSKSLDEFRPKPIDSRQYHTKIDGVIDLLFGDQIRKSEKERLAKDQQEYDRKINIYEASGTFSVKWFKEQKASKVSSINDKIIYHNKLAQEFNQNLERSNLEWTKDREALSSKLEDFVNSYKVGNEQGIASYFSLILRMSPYPEEFPRNIEVVFDKLEKVLLVEVELPNLKDRVITTYVSNREKIISDKERDFWHRKIQASIVARTFYEVADFDFLHRVDGICINGKMFYIDKSDGHEKSSYVVSAFAKATQVSGINIERIDPQVFLADLRARVSAKFDPSIAVLPILSFDKADRRVRENDLDIDQIDSRQNLASMDWEDFEKLVAILFSKIFPADTAEVKVTQASRDRGVDAIVWDTDPIKGGKFIIQAKRYTNTVDVAAVRDLYGTLVDEGANRGILVTTSSFGPDSISWAKDKPITLIGGTELLGLFEKYNYSFKIDLEEARALNRG